MLVHPARPIHFRLDLLHPPILGRALSCRSTRRVRVYLLVQFGKQLPGRFVPTPGGVGTRRQDVHPLVLGCRGSTLYGANV